MERRAFLLGAGAVLAAASARVGPAAGAGRRRDPSRVIVVGAGLAGLVAATELTRAGHDVVVLEARDRPGGRVLTLRSPFDDGLHAEAGALFISDTHTRVRHYCQDTGLTLRPVASRGASELYHVGGVTRTLDAASPAWPLALTDEERRLGLTGMWTRYIGSVLDDVREEYDGMTAGQFLRSRGASAGAVRLLGLGYLDLSGEGIESYSALAMLRDFARRRGERRTYAIEGGNDRLPRVLADRLGARVRYGAVVERIEPGARAAAVGVRSGAGPLRLTADRIVCAIPASVLRTVTVSPPFSPAKRRAIEAVSYTSVSRVHLQTRRAWPEHEPLALTTDLPIQWVWEASAGQAGPRAIVESYTAGALARRVGAMTADARLDFVRRELQRVRADVTAGFERGTSYVWDDDPWARGAYAWFKPGQVIGLARDLAGPEGRVHFAGEHVSSAPQWMEGAIESALRVVGEIARAEALGLTGTPPLV